MHHTKATSATKNCNTHLAMTDQSRSSADSAMPALSDKKSAASFAPEISRHKPGPMQCTETWVKTSSWRRYGTERLDFLHLLGHVHWVHCFLTDCSMQHAHFQHAGSVQGGLVLHFEWQYRGLRAFVLLLQCHALSLTHKEKGCSAQLQL